jgi:Arc/MetJ family transcription regulator
MSILVRPPDTRWSCNGGLFGRVAEIMGTSEQYMCVHTCSRACVGASTSEGELRNSDW